jgi:hypothetical protein
VGADVSESCWVIVMLTRGCIVHNDGWDPRLPIALRSIQVLRSIIEGPRDVNVRPFSTSHVRFFKHFPREEIKHLNHYF